MCNAAMMGAGMQAYGQYSAGQTANIEGQAAGDALDFQGRNERASAKIDASRIRRSGEFQRGQTLGAIAASGVKINQGSALDAERQVMEDAAIDEHLAILNGNQRALGLEMQGSSRRRAGRDAKRAGQIAAASSLLGAGAAGLKASGWRSAGPGFAGTQNAAPIETITPGARGNSAAYWKS